MSEVISANGNEEALLWSLLVDNEQIITTRQIAAPQDFHKEPLRYAYATILSLYDEGEGVDHISLLTQLQKSHPGFDWDGILFDLIDTTPSGLYAERYASEVSDAASRRRLVQAASDVAKAAYDREADIHATKSTAREVLDSALEDNVSANALSANDAADTVLEEIQAYADDPLGPGEVRGLSTGLMDLDAMTGGLGPGLYVIGGVQHIGKTAFCQQLAMNIAAAGKQVLFFSMEHSAVYMFHRIVSSLTKHSVREIQAGLNSKDLGTIHQAVEQLREWPLEIIEGRVSLSQIAAEIHARQRKGLSLVVVDNLELASMSVESRMDYVRFRDAAYRLLDTAQRYKVPLLATMQIGTKKVSNRANHRPNISDLYGADGPAQAASVVLLLHREDRWTFEEAEKDNLVDITGWKDKVFFSATGRGEQFIFGPQGQVWDQVEHHQQTPGVSF